MVDLEYSSEARNVLSLFHHVEKIVYVEGVDDVLFWEQIFEAVSGPSVKIEESGGKPQLKARISEIQSGTANYLVAIDADFDALSDCVEHPQLLRTLGYSIENTIVSAATLQRVICGAAKISKKAMSVDSCSQWLASISRDIHLLVAYDIINRVDNLGHAVLGDNCDRFMKSKKSSDICSLKIKRYIESLPYAVSADRFDAVIRQMRCASRDWFDLIRGHFLFSLSMRFVKAHVCRFRKNISISREMFFGSLMLAFEASFDEKHPHYKHYHQIVQKSARAG